MSERKTAGTYTLYGMRVSLYTGKPRSYLIKSALSICVHCVYF